MKRNDRIFFVIQCRVLKYQGRLVIKILMSNYILFKQKDNFGMKKNNICLVCWLKLN